MVGSDAPDAPVATHINGNCLVSCRRDALDWILRTVPTVHPSAGWDYAMRDEFKKHGWAGIPEIQSIYNTPHFTAAEYQSFVDKHWVWIHGDKSGDLIRHGRKALDL
jgi:hypothetical protein